MFVGVTLFMLATMLTAVVLCTYGTLWEDQSMCCAQADHCGIVQLCASAGSRRKLVQRVLNEWKKSGMRPPVHRFARSRPIIIYV